MITEGPQNCMVGKFVIGKYWKNYTNIVRDKRKDCVLLKCGSTKGETYEYTICIWQCVQEKAVHSVNEIKAVILTSS